LTAALPRADLNAYLTNYFPPSKVAAFVAWPAHEDSRITGEVFSVGGGRAARVVLAQAEGASVAQDTPEAWAAAAAQVMSLDCWTAALNIHEHLDAHLCEINAEGEALAGARRAERRGNSAGSIQAESISGGSAVGC